TLTIRIIGFTYQEIRGSVRSLNNLIGGFNPYTGTTTDNIQYIPAGTNPDDGDGGVWPEVKYETTAPLTFYYANLYFKDSIGSDSFPYTGKVEVEYGNECVYQVIFDETGSYPGTPWLGSSGMIYLNFTGYPEVQCPPGYHFNIPETYNMQYGMQYGETTYISTEILNGCGWNNVYEPPESYFKYELVGDTLSGTLRDLTTGRTGAVLDSARSLMIEFDMWGKEPDALETITLKVSAVNGTIDPATGTINVYPPEVRAIPGKSELTYGDTTSLTIEVRLPGGNWMPMPYDWYGTYTIMQADTFGFLYNTDSTVIGSSIRNKDPKINFAVNPETEPDSVEVLIQLFASEPCYNCGVGKIMPSDTMNLGSRQQPLKTSTLLKQRIQDNILTNHQSPMLKQQLTNNISKKSVSSTASPIRVNNNWHYGLARLMVKKKPLCPVVEMSKKDIYPGDTVFLSVVGKDQNNNKVPYSADQTFDVSIPEGAEYGILKSLSTGRTGTSLSNDKGPFLFIANEAINVNSCDVVIEAWPSNGGGAAPLMKGGAKSEPQSLLAKTKMSTRMLTVNSSCEPPQKTLSLQNITGLVLTTSPNSISCQQSLPIEIKAQGGGKISDDAMVNVYTHGDDAEFGNIVNDSTGQSAKAMTVRYADIKSGKVKFVPDCTHIQGRFPQGVRFGVNLAEKTKLAAANGVIVKGPNSGEWFTQGDPRWTGQQYDKYIDSIKQNGDTVYHNIGQKGCALSCMAMAMSAYGIQTDPGKLDKYMDSTKHWFPEGQVDWNAVGDYNKSTKFDKPDVEDKGKILQQSDLDIYLSKGGPVIVKVYDKKGINHWVIVTGKRGNNYDILDPASQENIKTSLSDYGDTTNPIKIYKIVNYPTK
ncbi:MAG: hypothetical protein ABSD46_14150, partial [Bacteroidota bacterium]